MVSIAVVIEYGMKNVENSSLLKAPSAWKTGYISRKNNKNLNPLPARNTNPSCSEYFCRKRMISRKIAAAVELFNKYVPPSEPIIGIPDKCDCITIAVLAKHSKIIVNRMNAFESSIIFRHFSNQLNHWNSNGRHNANCGVHVFLRFILDVQVFTQLWTQIDKYSHLYAQRTEA